MNGPRVVALAGGVGGAKLAAGLQAVLPPGALSVIVNTGDDFEHWGLTVCPDIDTVLYNLAGIHNPETGWGRAGDSFVTLQAMEQFGGEDWFRIGDRDLATHLRRSEWLHQGATLSEVTERLRRSLGIPSVVTPMSDEPVRTLVHTDEGDLPFQHYFVRRRCEPCVVDLTYRGRSRGAVERPGPQGPPTCRPRRRLSKQPLSEYRPDPQHSRRAPFYPQAAGPQDRRFADCRRTGNQGACRKDDG